MKKKSFIIPLLITLSLVFPQNISPLLAAPNPVVVTNPAVITPDSAFTTRATGFAPNNTIHISYNGETEGAARHIIEGYFGELTKKTDEDGSALFSGLTGVYEGGAQSFTFKDEAGNTATGTVTIKGKAPRPFLFGPKVEVTAENIQIGLTGVGWNAEKKKSVRGLDPNEQAYTPQQLFDLCQGAPCPEREDALKLVIIIPRSTPSGSNTLIVDEEGAGQVRTFVTIPELPENKKVAEREAEIFLIDPPAATVDVTQIYVRGAEWGAYDDRRSPRAWLVDPDTEAFHELKVAANYRDCSFVRGDQKISGGCLLETDEMFLRLEIPEEIKPTLTPKKYLLFVKTEKNVYGRGVFTVMAKPTFDPKKGTAIAVIPDRGPVGTNTLLFGAAFPKKQFIDVRFDGVYVRLGGALWPDDDGTFENIPLQIPRMISKNGKDVAITPGTHTISLSTKDAVATATFIVEGLTDEKKKKEEKERLKKEEEAHKKKEQEERERIEKEQKKLKEEQEKAKKEEEHLKKERKKLEEDLKKKKEEEQKEKDKEDRARLEKERKKLEEDLKKKKEEEQKKEKQVEDVKDKKEKVDDRFCDSTLPLTFQPGCIQKKATPQKGEYEGRPCRADMAITFQPGCVGQKPDEQKQLFAGKRCTADLPMTFQPGCYTEPESQKTSPQYYVPDSTGKRCQEGIAITFQPGCVPGEKPAETTKQFTGKTCDPDLPRVWQEGCVDASQKAADQKPQAQLYTPDSAGKPCKEGIAITFQPGCVSQTKEMPAAAAQKPFMGKQCDPNLPRVWQEGCVDASGKTTPVQQQTQVQATVNTKEAPVCNPLVPTYTQPGCRQP